jgi:hypothetical protein
MRVRGIDKPIYQARKVSSVLEVSINTSTKPGSIPLTRIAHFPGLIDVFIDTSNTHCPLS